MANELKLPPGIAPTGSTVYVLQFNDAGQCWSTEADPDPAFATLTTTRDDFDLPASEVGGTGLFLADVVGPAGGRWWQWWLQPGGSPSATADLWLGTGKGYWNGTNIVDLSDNRDGAAIPSVAQIGAAVTITPVVSIITPAGELVSQPLTIQQYAAFTGTFTLLDSTGAAIDDDGDSFTLVVSKLDKVTHVFQVGSLTAGGASGNQVPFTIPDEDTQTAGTFFYQLWNTTKDIPRAENSLTITKGVEPTA